MLKKLKTFKLVTGDSTYSQLFRTYVVGAINLVFGLGITYLFQFYVFFAIQVPLRTYLTNIFAFSIGVATRFMFNAFALNDSLGASLNNEATGYLFVYHIELALLVVTLVILSPLIKSARNKETKSNQKSADIGIADFPM